MRVSQQDTNTFLCVSHNKTRIRRVPVNLLFIRLAQKHRSVIISTTSVLTCFHMTASSTVTKGVYVLCVFKNSLMNYLVAFTYVTFCLIKPSKTQECHVVRGSPPMYEQRKPRSVMLYVVVHLCTSNENTGVSCCTW